jgi:N-acetyl-anhydromuramyl-L-alanine amidase AmpD
MAENKPQYIVVHHSATADNKSFNDTVTIRKNHIAQGWIDIGYHYTVEYVDGKVMVQQGRPEWQRGAHCDYGGMNFKSVGICVIGNFNLYPPPDEMLAALVKLIKSIRMKYKIPIDKVVGHKDTGAATACPGKYFKMDKVHKMLKEADKPQNDWEGHWNRNDIKLMISEGIMVGDLPDGSKWRPEDGLKRHELATVIANLIRRGRL